MSRHLLIGLPEHPWVRMVEGLRPGTTWGRVARLAELVPRHGDRVAGFFSLAETALMQRFGLQVLTFAADGKVLPDAERALRDFRELQLVPVASVVASRRNVVPFEAGPEALCRAAVARARRTAAHSRTREGVY